MTHEMPAGSTQGMKAVTRDIDARHAQDLLERVPRACIAFAGQHGPECVPVRLVWRDGRYLVGIPGGISPRPAIGQEIVLLVDEGIHWYDLRAVYVRGHVTSADPPTGAPPRHMWLELAADKTVAWDYGRLRQAGDET